MGLCKYDAVTCLLTAADSYCFPTQGRVKHLRGPSLGALEDQMCRMTLRGYEGKGSPDRLDALVWAIHELMIEPAAGFRQPMMRTL